METTTPIAVDESTKLGDRAGVDTGWKAKMVEADRQWQNQREQEAALMPRNKAALCEALAAAGICRVVVAFDGSGDSGQIESFDAFGTGDQVLALPAGTALFASIEFGAPEPTAKQVGLRDVVEALAYGLLEQTHDGWENDDGAFGEFVFDVAAGSITLEYNERYTAADYHVHEF